MDPQSDERRLVAILSADAVEYSRLMAEDEAATVRTLTAYRAEITLLVGQHRGRVVDAPGDNLLAEFPSALDATHCAVEVQRVLAARNADLPGERRMEFRIGIHLGDVMVEGGRIYGDGVNIAARLEGLAEPGGICISATVQEQVRHKLDLEYEDLGEREIKNIPDPVPVYRVRLQPEAAVADESLRGADDSTASDFRDPPSVAVLPFTNMSGDPEQEYFSDGISEDLITDLARISGLFVIARNSSFVYKGRAVSVQQVGRDLGARYVLEGSVRKANDRVRITAQLVDARTGGHVWAERYDRKLEDIFAVQDDVTRRIVDSLEVRLTETEQAGGERSRTNNLEAYDYLLRGIAYLSGPTAESNRRARVMLERAIELDPAFADAYEALAGVFAQEWAHQWSEDPEVLDHAVEIARRALELDDSLSRPHVVLAWHHSRHGRLDEALAEAEKAVASGPNLADPHGMLAAFLNLAGRPEEAIPAVKKAIRLEPQHAWHPRQALAESYRQTGRPEEAIAELKRSINENPDFLTSHLFLARVYAELGREEEAKREGAEVLRISPGFSLGALRQLLRYKDPAETERAIHALRKAGLKE